MELLALTNGWIYGAILVALGLLLIWMLLEIMFRSDFTGGMKIAWIVIAVLFAPVAIPVWFLWVRRKDYSNT